MEEAGHRREGKPTTMHGPGCTWQASPRGGWDWPRRSCNGGCMKICSFRIADRSRSIFRWQLWFFLLSYRPSKITSLSKSLFCIASIVIVFVPKNPYQQSQNVPGTMSVTIRQFRAQRTMCPDGHACLSNWWWLSLFMNSCMPSSRRNHPLQAILPRLGKRSWILVTWEEPDQTLQLARQRMEEGGCLGSCCWGGARQEEHMAAVLALQVLSHVPSQGRVLQEPTCPGDSSKSHPPPSASLRGDNKAEVTKNRKPLVEMVALGEGADLMPYPIFSSVNILLPSCRFWQITGLCCCSTL